MVNQYDHLECRCRILGQQVTFHYCRTAENNLLCGKIADCWFERIDIEKFLKENYTADDIGRLKKPVKPKVHSLLDLIKKAQERNRDAD